VQTLINFPLLLFAFSLVVLFAAARIGFSLRAIRGGLDEDTRKDFDVVRAATLTLLGLIIGFTFSMAANRYEQRKSYEEEEANAIGTEFLRVDSLPADDAAKVKSLLISYLDQRILFYQSRHADQLQQINSRTAQLEIQLWSAVQVPAAAQPTPMTALAVAGINDVLNSQGYTQASWWNRIPLAAWFLMGAIAIYSNLLIGYGARSDRPHFRLLIALPLIVSVAFFFIADIDSPRSGVIRVRPENLTSLSQSLKG
jgi:hypothetical protein